MLGSTSLPLVRWGGEVEPNLHDYGRAGRLRPSRSALHRHGGRGHQIPAGFWGRNRTGYRQHKINSGAELSVGGLIGPAPLALQRCRAMRGLSCPASLAWPQPQFRHIKLLRCPSCGGRSMSKWIEEAMRAPRDAWALLLGLASACSIFALLHHPFEKEPLRAVVEHWQFWSQEFWGALASFAGWSIPKTLAISLTTMVFSCAVLLRGVLRGQVVEWAHAEAQGSERLLRGLFLLLTGGVAAAGYTIMQYEALGSQATGVVTLLPNLVGALALASALQSTPRSFFAVVIAAIALLLIDRIPLLPAATVVAGS